MSESNKGGGLGKAIAGTAVGAGMLGSLVTGATAPPQESQSIQGQTHQAAEAQGLQNDQQREAADRANSQPAQDPSGPVVDNLVPPEDQRGNPTEDEESD